MVVAGIVVCLIGAGIASGNGEMLFPKDIGDGEGYVYDLTTSPMDKVKISVGDADVNIIGGADDTHVEIINFNENLCSFSGSTSIVSFTESKDISSMINFWDNGFSFKGLRYFFRFSTPDGRKTVNVYLSDKKDVKMFEIKADSGKISISDIKGGTDYDIAIGSGTVKMNNIETTSSVHITASDTTTTTVNFDNVKAENIDVTAQKADIKAKSLTVSDCSVSVDTGGVTVDPYVPMHEIYTVDITTPGKLSVNGEKQLDHFSYDGTEGLPDNGDAEEIPVAHLNITGRELAVKLETAGDILPKADSDTVN